MRCLRHLPLSALLSLCVPGIARAEPWAEVQGFFTESASLGSSMVDAADLDADGYIDLVFANGGGTNKGNPDSDLPQQAFHNDAAAAMSDWSADIFAGATFNGRAVKLRDVDRDDDIDIVLGVTWQSQSQLYLNGGAGDFVNETGTHLPALEASVGDLELGDVDGDGDLDIVLADWGAYAPVDSVNAAGKISLWEQIGKPKAPADPSTGMFADVTAAHMPSTPVRWAWDLELVDVNNDWRLDIVISCFACDDHSVLLFGNDGDGNFVDVTLETLAEQGLEGLGVEAMDIDGDAFLDLVSLHDGPSGRNRVLINDHTGVFTDESNDVWPLLQNPPSYDQAAAFLDQNSDGRPDMVVGALNPGINKYPDRLIENHAGVFEQNTFAFAQPKPTGGTYAIALADLNDDGILDVAMAQNENAFDKKVFIGNNIELSVDVAPPVLPLVEDLPDDLEFGAGHSLRVRCHDNKSPVMAHDFQRAETVDGVVFADGRPYVESWTADPGPDLDANPGAISAPGRWYGEYLWKIDFMVPADGDRFVYRICAIDAAHNRACTEPKTRLRELETTTDAPTSTDASSSSGAPEPTGSATGGDGSSDSGDSDAQPTGALTTGEPIDPTLSSISDTATTTAGQLDDDGCGCRHAPGPGGALAVFMLLALGRRRRPDVTAAARR